MLFSAIILSYNSSRTVERCLESLAKAFSGFDEQSEILVFENGSQDDSVNLIRGFEDKIAKGGDFPNVGMKVVYSQENTGTTYSRNTLLNMSTGKYVLVLDSDAYIDASELLKLKDALDKDTSVGMSVPKLFYGDGRYQMSTDVFPTLWRKAQRFLSLDKMQGDVQHEQLVDVDVDYAISACWLIRRDAVDAVGGFDEAIFYSPEDVDYCMQLWSQGFRIRFISSANVIHDAQELSHGFKLSFFHFSHLKGLFYLFAKYRYFFGLSGLYKRMGRV